MQYRKSKENAVANALSKRPISSKECCAVPTVVPDWLSEVQQSYKRNTKLLDIITTLLIDPQSHIHYSLDQGLLRYKGRFFISNHGNLREKLLQVIHSSALGGHSRINNTFQRMKSLFFFFYKGLKFDVKKRVSNCDICLQNKSDNYLSSGLL